MLQHCFLFKHYNKYPYMYIYIMITMSFSHRNLFFSSVSNEIKIILKLNKNIYSLGYYLKYLLWTLFLFVVPSNNNLNNSCTYLHWLETYVNIISVHWNNIKKTTLKSICSIMWKYFSSLFFLFLIHYSEDWFISVIWWLEIMWENTLRKTQTRFEMFYRGCFFFTTSFSIMFYVEILH